MSNPVKHTISDTDGRVEVADTATLPRQIWLSCEAPYSVGFAYSETQGDAFPLLSGVTKFNTAQDIWVEVLQTGIYNVWVWEAPEGLL